MTLPGEGGQGLQHNQLTDAAYMDLIERLDVSGWATGGGWGDDVPHNIGIVRVEGRGNISPGEAIERLHLAGEDGELLPGYEVTTDKETGQLALGYEGPGDSRYVQFLSDLIDLGDTIDEASIEASPYPEALEQWRLRYRLRATRPIYQSLEQHISPRVKELRDHIVIERNGVTKLLELLAEGASYTTIPGSHERLSQAAGKIQAAMAAGSPAERDNHLDIALQDADSSIQATLEGYETRAFGVPGVTEAFAREVMVDSPLYWKDPISEEDLEGLLAFEDSADGDGPPRTSQAKLIQLGKILYHIHGSIEPRGILSIFNDKQDLFNGKTAREVIDTGTPEDNERLLNWAVGTRGMVAS